MKKIALLIAAISGLTFSAEAAVIWTNPITGTNPNTSNPYTTGQTFDPNITVSGIGRGPGIAGNNANDRYNANSWNTVSIDTDAYFTFTLDANTGYEIDFTSLVYTGQASGTGPTSFVVRSSIDGFTSNIATPGVGATIDLSGAAFQNLTTPVTFRIYGFGASAATGTYSINDFTFNGTVVSVPEPASYAMCIGGVGMMFALIRRKRLSAL